MEKALITACSNKFFPAAVNLIGSIKAKYPEHPTIFVYDLGLLMPFRKELERMENVTVLRMQAFCPHWRSCFTWKTYIFAHPPARLNFYIDSGFQVLRPLDAVFEQIERDDYLAVSQNWELKHIAPREYADIIPVEARYYEETYVTAGILGFKKDSKISGVLQELYDAGLAGLCLGFSPKEAWRNKGPDKNPFVRDCDLFRFDTSVFSMLMRRDLGDFKISPQELYESHEMLGGAEQFLFNARLKYVRKENICAKDPLVRAYIRIFLVLKKVSLAIKGRK